LENLEKDNEIYLITAEEAQALVKQGYKEALKWVETAVEKFPNSDPKTVLSTAYNLISSEKVFDELNVEHFADVKVETLPSIDEEAMQNGGIIIKPVVVEEETVIIEEYAEANEELSNEDEAHEEQLAITEDSEDSFTVETHQPETPGETSIFDQLMSKYGNIDASVTEATSKDEALEEDEVATTEELADDLEEESDEEDLTSPLFDSLSAEFGIEDIENFEEHTSEEEIPEELTRDLDSESDEEDSLEEEDATEEHDDSEILNAVSIEDDAEVMETATESTDEEPELIEEETVKTSEEVMEDIEDEENVSSETSIFDQLMAQYGVVDSQPEEEVPSDTDTVEDSHSNIDEETISLDDDEKINPSEDSIIANEEGIHSIENDDQLYEENEVESEEAYIVEETVEDSELDSETTDKSEETIASETIEVDSDIEARPINTESTIDYEDDEEERNEIEDDVFEGTIEEAPEEPLRAETESPEDNEPNLEVEAVEELSGGYEDDSTPDEPAAEASNDENEEKQNELVGDIAAEVTPDEHEETIEPASDGLYAEELHEEQPEEVEHEPSVQDIEASTFDVTDYYDATSEPVVAESYNEPEVEAEPEVVISEEQSNNIAETEEIKEESNVKLPPVMPQPYPSAPPVVYTNETVSLGGGNNLDEDNESEINLVAREGIDSDLSVGLTRYEYEESPVDNGEIVFDNTYQGEGFVNNTLKSQNLEGLLKAQSSMGVQTSLELSGGEYDPGAEYVSITEEVVKKEAEENPEVNDTFGGNTNIILPSVSYQAAEDLIEIIPEPENTIEVAEQFDGNKKGELEDEMFVPVAEIDEEELKQYASSSGISREDRNISMASDSGIVIENIVEEPAYTVNEAELDAPLPAGSDKYVASISDEDNIPTIDEDEDEDEDDDEAEDEENQQSSRAKSNINSRQLIQDVRLLDSLD
jgi:hypothetical protein